MTSKTPTRNLKLSLSGPINVCVGGISAKMTTSIQSIEALILEIRESKDFSGLDLTYVSFANYNISDCKFHNCTINPEGFVGAINVDKAYFDNSAITKEIEKLTAQNARIQKQHQSSVRQFFLSLTPDTIVSSPKKPENTIAKQVAISQQPNTLLGASIEQPKSKQKEHPSKGLGK